MSLILAAFFGGITFFSYYFGIVPNSHATVLSQIGSVIFNGHGIGFYLLQLSTAMILAVAANTGFRPFRSWLLIWLKTSICRMPLWIVGIV